MSFITFPEVHILSVHLVTPRYRQLSPKANNEAGSSVQGNLFNLLDVDGGGEVGHGGTGG